MSGGIEVLDLFSAAAGGWSLGMHRAGFTTMAACEVEAWRRALYSENNPNVKVYYDVRTLTADRLLADLGRLPSVVVGSPPCQDISSANTKGRGVEGERSGLYFEAVRIIGECRPRWFALENSANLRTRGYDSVQAALEAVGYTCWPCVVRAGDIDANHDRARAWVLGCDLTQVADANGERWDEGQGGRWSRLDLSVPSDPCDAEKDGCRSWVPGRCSGAVAGPEQQARGNVAHADCNSEHAPSVHGEVAQLRRVGSDREPDVANADQAEWGPRELSGGARDGAPCGRDEGADQPRSLHSASGEARNPSNAHEARQAHGCVEPGIRQAEIADDGRCVGRSDDGSVAGQVGLRSPDRRTAFGHRADWSLADLADHLRLDDGLSTRLARHRVDIGDGKGQSAASLIVEAFGDAVIPQIPEAIGRAILRTERALSEIYGRLAA